MTGRRLGVVVLLSLGVLLGSGGPVGAQETDPSTTVATVPGTSEPRDTSPEVLDVPVPPPASDASAGPRLTTEDEGEGAPMFLIVGVVASALATVVILFFVLRSRRSGDPAP